MRQIPSLLGGGGVDGAIHRAAGPALLAACKQVLQQQGECPPGHAVITIAGNLPASAVIHTVGPVWHGGDRMEAQTPADAYKNSLQLASANNYRSIAFPAISTGVYGLSERGSGGDRRAHRHRVSSLAITLFERVLFVCFDEETAAIYRRLLASYPLIQQNRLAITASLDGNDG